MFQVISLFGLSIPIAPVALLLAYVVGSDLTERALGRAAPMNKQVAWRRAVGSASTLAFVGGLIGARLAYAVQYSQLYLESPGLLLSLRPGTLDLVVGLVIGSVIGWLYLRRAGVPLSSMVDALAIGATGALLILSLGDFLTGRNYGAPADLFWGVELWGAVRHPVQLYNALAMAIILGALWTLQPKVLVGELFWRFILLYSLSQLIVNTFCANALTWGPGIRVWQSVALAALLISMYVLSFFAQYREQHDDDPPADADNHKPETSRGAPQNQGWVAAQ